MTHCGEPSWPGRWFRLGWPSRMPASTVAASTAASAMAGLLELVQTIPYNPSPDALVIDPLHPHEAPTEEFRTLRTRLNHMQSLQPIHTAVVTSPSPAEGKSFAAINLALAEAQLAGNLTLLCDFDLRRPSRAQPAANRSRSRHHRLSAGKGPAAPGHAPSRRHESLHHAGRRTGHQSAGAAQSEGGQANARSFAEPLQLGDSRQPAAVVRRRREPAFHALSRHAFW